MSNLRWHKPAPAATPSSVRASSGPSSSPSSRIPLAGNSRASLVGSSGAPPVGSSRTSQAGSSRTSLAGSSFHLVPHLADTDPAAGRLGTGGAGLRAARGTQHTRERYGKQWFLFLDWASIHSVRTESVHELDLALGEYLETLHGQDEGRGKQNGRDLLAAAKKARPEVSKWGKEGLPFACDALKAWEDLNPDHSRRPMPWPFAAAVISDILHRSAASPIGSELFRYAMILILAFDAYLRLPSEVRAMRPGDIFRPPRKGDPWTLLVAPQERLEDERMVRTGDRTKTGTCDMAVAISRPPHPRAEAAEFAAAFLSRLSLPTLLTTQDDARRFIAEFALSCDRVGLQAFHWVPYQFRHGGASEDFALFERDRSQGRDLGVIKKRGRWKTDSSVSRYEKSGLLLASLSMVPRDVRKHAESCARRLSIYCVSPSSAPSAPLAHAFPDPQSSRALALRRRGSALSAPPVPGQASSAVTRQAPPASVPDAKRRRLEWKRF